MPPELPQLIGPPGFEAEMTARCLAVQVPLEQGGLRLTRMSLDERGAWDMTFDNGISLRLGRENVDERFERFLTAAASIVTGRAAARMVVAAVDETVVRDFVGQFKMGDVDRTEDNLRFVRVG